MKKEKIILLVIIGCLLLLLIGGGIYKYNQNKYVKDLNLEEVKEKISNKDRFILYIKKDKCSACEAFSPKFKKVLAQYEIVVYSINLSKIDDDERDKFNELITGVDATPTVIFYENGVDVGARFVGTRDKDYIVSKLKDLGYIKNE